MKVIEETLVKGQSRKEIVTVGKKKFTREASSNGIDWRRYKTNHQVKKMEFEVLEKEYQASFLNHFEPNEFFKHSKKIQSKPGVIENDDERKRVESGLVKASNNGRALLMGVKYVKEQTGWGLRDSKEFVQSFFERKKVFHKN